MTIRTRLTRLFTLLVSLLLGVFCAVIYTLSERYRQTEFYEQLRQEALTSAQLLFGRETISPQLFKLLDKNQMTVLNQEEIIIYDNQNKIAYESGTDYLTVPVETLNQIRLQKQVQWRQDDREIVGVLFSDRYNHFVVLASGVDKYGFLKQRDLAIILSAGWLLATVVVWLVGLFFSTRALAPIKQVVKQVDTITATNLDLRLDEGEQQDEIAQLSHRFNRMLDRLEAAFQAQRAFVANASHELRTPLTAITGQIQVALLADDDPDELRAVMRSVLDDVRGLNQLTNGLLDLADVSLGESAVITTVPVLLDELLWQTRAELLKTYPDYTIRLSQPEAGEGLVGVRVMGNEALLRIAFLNLLENGCKFSPNKTVTVQMETATSPNYVTLHIRNGGPAIPALELPLIFKPLRRGSNARHVRGYGIGLSLTERIVRLHKGQISVESTTESSTTFTLMLPRP
ncbi:HAMP domain-containing sensor histidine kinase [Spirosoma utsteinense]|uniref:histidine kinase n=1 Tax=Spirosoma utsteinense TaxID=2585773 RepID=A0ABR6W2T7_9BACT|nr:HAMP domain-containing sensor histidine kinase [Spirosoma utsteinense]MBC3784971.1 signal transduction histidine kinase [Spirosoma utsteinense]MBC3790421.1 signal transduction histidine kinase [Spirosoma utsteinense]